MARKRKAVPSVKKCRMLLKKWYAGEITGKELSAEVIRLANAQISMFSSTEMMRRGEYKIAA